MIPLAQAIADAVAALTAAGVPSPQADAELLAGHVLGLTRGAVQARSLGGAVLDDPDSDDYRALIRRRSAREPLQHLTGVAHFRALTLSVGPGVFVPRPETEIVAQFAIDALAATPVPERAEPTPVPERAQRDEGAEPRAPRAVDLGTGSGALAIALATEVPHSEVWAVEVSPDAFVWAKLNARANSAANVHLVLGDLVDALPELDGTVDVVVSNPPYIPSGMIPRDPEVRHFDPELALYGGEDGLDAVRALERTAHRLLHDGGTLVIEHAEIQGEAIRALLAGAGWRAPQTHADLTGRPRATVAIR